MSKGLIVYFSLGGTTACVAESIAAGLCAAEYRVDLCNIKDAQPPGLDGYDLLGIGSRQGWTAMTCWASERRHTITVHPST